jgi:GDP-4-dehydro-6-deoxy-D-mannose reductase
LQRLLITGANGFVGRHLIRQLLISQPQSEIAAVVRPEELDAAAAWAAGKSSRVQCVAADIVCRESIADAIAGFRPEAVVHLAARSSGADADRDAVMAANVDGSRHVLQACKQQGSCKRVIMVSTGYVYGSTDPGNPPTEDCPVISPGKYGLYADSKVEMERVCGDYREFAIIVRPFSHTGPGQASNFAISSFARQIAEIEKGVREPEVKVGNLDALRDMLHVADVVRAYEGLLACGVPGAVYNVASAKPVSIRAMLQLLISESTVKIEVVVDSERLRPADIACSSGSYARLHALLGWSPQCDLRHTMADTLNYWRMQV